MQKNSKNSKTFLGKIEKEESIEELKRWIDVATISPIYPLQSGLYKGGYRFSLDSEKLFDLIS